MPYRSMTLKELAHMMGADSRRLERMAQRGEIPCQKVGGQFRFNRAAVTEWLQQNMATMGRDGLAEVDAGMTAHRQTEEDQPIVAVLLRPEAIDVNLGSRTKGSTVRALVSLAEKTGLVYDSAGLLEAVLHREDLCTTAMPGGIAIPHPRRPLPYSIAEPVLVVARTGQGIVFGAPDGKLTRVFFLTASQDDRHHLHVLARLCRMLHDDSWVQELVGVESTEEMIDLLTQRESDVIASGG